MKSTYTRAPHLSGSHSLSFSPTHTNTHLYFGGYIYETCLLYTHIRKELIHEGNDDEKVPYNSSCGYKGRGRERERHKNHSKI